jgi:hypothetical protein
LILRIFSVWRFASSVEGEVAFILKSNSVDN